MRAEAKADETHMRVILFLAAQPKYAKLPAAPWAVDSPREEEFTDRLLLLLPPLPLHYKLTVCEVEPLVR